MQSEGSGKKSISLRLAKEGLNVVASNLLQRSGEPDELVKEIHTETKAKAVSHIGDILKEANVDNLVSTAGKEFGRLDVVSSCWKSSKYYDNSRIIFHRWFVIPGFVSQSSDWQ